MIKLFVGLGNPGPEYEDTRHNAGFWWIDALARELKVQLVPERSYFGLMARASVRGENVWLLQPQTDRKSTRLNSSHLVISYAVFCLKKKRLEAQRLLEPHFPPDLSQHFPLPFRSSTSRRFHSSGPRAPTTPPPTLCTRSPAPLTFQT